MVDINQSIWNGFARIQEKPQNIIQQTQNNLFIWLTGSIATIKIFDVLEDAKDRWYNAIWHSTEKWKQFVLSAFYGKLQKIIHGIEDEKTKDIVGDFMVDLRKYIKNSINKEINLIDIFIRFTSILEENRIDTTLFSSVVDMIHTYEEGRDFDGVISKEKGHVKHINIAEWADKVLLAPVTANTLAKIVNGTTDNFLLEVVRAIPGDKKVYLAIAMNTHMLNDPFIQKNISDVWIEGKGKYIIIPPISKTLQCGTVWNGAMEEVTSIFDFIKGDDMSEDREKKASPQLGIVISSGGTNVYIDDVRCISNFSKWTTWSLIAEEAITNGHKVEYICSKETIRPFESALKINLEEDLSSELARLSDFAKFYPKAKENLNIVPVRDFYAYHEKILESIKNNKTDVVILSMAASDYWPEQVKGKISSDKEELVISMKKLPKIISEIKKVRKDIFLVGFKLLTDSSVDQLIEIAYKSMLRDGQDLAVANIALDKSFSKFVTYIITVEKSIISVPNRADLQKILMKTIQNRVSKKHYSTEFTKVDELPLMESDIEWFIAHTKEVWKLALFEPYIQWDRREFWFVAKRTDKGTLITWRWSSKNNASIADIALVTDMDQEKRSMKVVSTEKKASLNANLAHYIFEERKEVNRIVHAHINLPDIVDLEKETSPGTQEDLDAIKWEVVKWSSIISQTNHGILILMKDIHELPEILKKHNIYTTQSEYYDFAYNRFSKSNRFINIIKEHVKKESKILDMCAGTWEVTKALLQEWYKDIACADASVHMLERAKEKNTSMWESQFRTISLEEINFEQEFDAVVIRQAINYIAPDKMVDVFRRIKNSLKKWGKFIFNSFIFTTNPSSITRKDDKEQLSLITYEDNLVKNGKIYHGQQTHIFNKETWVYKKIYDINSFYISSQEEFYKALQDAGFNDIQIIVEKKSLYFIATNE